MTPPSPRTPRLPAPAAGYGDVFGVRKRWGGKRYGIVAYDEDCPCFIPFGPVRSLDAN